MTLIKVKLLTTAPVTAQQEPTSAIKTHFSNTTIID